MGMVKTINHTVERMIEMFGIDLTSEEIIDLKEKLLNEICVQSGCIYYRGSFNS